MSRPDDLAPSCTGRPSSTRTCSTRPPTRPRASSTVTSAPPPRGRVRRRGRRALRRGRRRPSRRQAVRREHAKGVGWKVGDDLVTALEREEPPRVREQRDEVAPPPVRRAPASSNRGRRARRPSRACDSRPRRPPARSRAAPAGSSHARLPVATRSPWRASSSTPSTVTLPAARARADHEVGDAEEVRDERGGRAPRTPRAARRAAGSAVRA